MKGAMNRNFGTRFIPACALAAMAVLTACSDKQDVAGGASGDMGIVAKDIAGEALKGPVVKGSAVTVQGIDCKTMKFSDEVFEGKVKSNKGDFAFDDVTLSSTCAVFEATGKYRSEITGKESAGEITLHALTDLKDRKNVEGWGYADVVPAFEKYIEVFGDTVILSSSSFRSSSSTPVEDLSSSSVTLAVPCKTETEDNCEYGTLTDERDGQTYKTVKIGDQVWMAENLNIDAANSCCYHDSAEYCSKYGRLYNWAGAMDAEGKWSTNSVNCRYTGECSPTYPVRGACPEGWHLPDSTEWGKLLTAVGGLDVAAKMLKSTSGWQDCEEENCNGTDAYGFSALPAGYMDRYGSAFTYYEGVSTGFYTSTQVDKNDAYRVYLSRNNVVNFTSDIKADGFSVRCVKDESPVSGSSSSVASSSSRSDNRTVSYKMTRPIAFLDTVNRRYYYVDDHCAYDPDNDKYKWVQGDAPKGIVTYDLDDYAVGGQPGGIYFLGYKISNDTLYKCHTYTNACDEPSYANVYVGNSGSFLGTWKSVSQLPSGILRSVTNRDVELTVSPESFTFQVSYTVPPFYYTSEHCTLIYYITGDNDFNTKCLAIFKNANYPNTDIADTVHVTDDIWIAKKGVDGVVTSINGKIIESHFSYAFDPDTYNEELYRMTIYNGIECSYNSKMIEVVKSKELCEELDPDVYNRDDKFEYSNFSEFMSCFSQYGF